MTLNWHRESIYRLSSELHEIDTCYSHAGPYHICRLKSTGEIIGYKTQLQDAKRLCEQHQPRHQAA